MIKDEFKLNNNIIIRMCCADGSVKKEPTLKGSYK